MADSQAFARLKERIQAEPQLQAWHQKLAERGQEILGAAPSRYEIPDGLRLLSTSRRVLQRVYALALL